MRMTKKELASICSLLIAGAAFGVTTNVVQTFDTFALPYNSSTDGWVATAGNWVGSGTVTNGTYTAPAAGLPISNTAANYLIVDGDVICSNQTTASTPVMLDMMVQATVPDEELAFEDEESSNNVQIAVGVDSNNTMKVYCTSRSGTILLKARQVRGTSSPLIRGLSLRQFL